MTLIHGKLIAGIIFDLDNTLISTRKGDIKAIDMVADYLHQSYEIEISRAKKITLLFLKKFRFEPRIYEEIDENGEFIPLDIDQWRIRIWKSVLRGYEEYAEDVYRKWLKVRYSFVTSTSEIKSMLLKLRKTYKLGLLTNGDSDAQWEKINLLELKDYFDAVLVSGDVGCEKPNPKVFFKICHDLGVKPEQCLMVGDTMETDIKGAISAKFALTAFVITDRYDEHKTEEFKRIPDIVLNKATDLETVIGGDCNPL